MIDETLIEAYHNAGMEVWAWSYNYTNNNEAQAEALYMAAQTGYDGYVVDVEMEFDNKPVETENLFAAFYNVREQAISEQIIDENFKIYCTTWGNPKDHLFPIDKIDPYVDGFMPQTYVEVWGDSFLENLTFWIEEGNLEYAELGATKPIHHIAAMESGQMTGEQVNEFMIASGAETSIWRIPGGGTPLSIWDEWDKVDWDYDFCESTFTTDVHTQNITLFPNPASSYLNLSLDRQVEQLEILDMNGSVIAKHNGNQHQIDVSSFPNGLYTLKIHSAGNWYHERFLVTH